MFFLNRHFKQQVPLNKSANDTSLSLDDYIASKAAEQNIGLYGLETTEEQQINLINNDYNRMGLRAEEFDNSSFSLSPFDEEMILQNKKFEKIYSAGRYLYTKEIGLIAF